MTGMSKEDERVFRDFLDRLPSEAKPAFTRYLQAIADAADPETARQRFVDECAALGVTFPLPRREGGAS